MAAAHGIDDPRDEGPLADLTSAGMWTTAGLIGAGMFLLPGSPHDHLTYGLLIAAAAILWGAASLLLWRKRWTMSITQRALVTTGTAPLVTAAIWASGGATSFLQPLLLFTALFISYFFPPRLAWPLVGVFAAVYSTPLFYDPAAIDETYPARALGFAVALAGATVVVQLLKRRLLRAEERQRVMAERDPLTDLHNRRSFDAALEQALESAAGAALVLFDFDAFKAINDRHGHPVGDAVLRAVAAACAEIVRGDDCLARLGGDEFAVIAPRAGSAGVARIVASLEDAIAGADLPAPVDRVAASFAWAVAPLDGTSASQLLDRADQRLLYRKRLNKAAL
jgi:diguanylate cyclase (GGDEF)-like protein